MLATGLCQTRLHPLSPVLSFFFSRFLSSVILHRLLGLVTTSRSVPLVSLFPERLFFPILPRTLRPFLLSVRHWPLATAPSAVRIIEAPRPSAVKGPSYRVPRASLSSRVHRCFGLLAFRPMIRPCDFIRVRVYLFLQWLPASASHGRLDDRSIMSICAIEKLNVTRCVTLHYLIIPLILSVNVDDNFATVRIKSYTFTLNFTSILSNKRPGNPIAVRDFTFQLHMPRWFIDSWPRYAIVIDGIMILKGLDLSTLNIAPSMNDSVYCTYFFVIFSENCVAHNFVYWVTFWMWYICFDNWGEKDVRDVRDGVRGRSIRIKWQSLWLQSFSRGTRYKIKVALVK